MTGSNGQVGYELQSSLVALGEVTAVNRSDMDLTSSDSIRACVRSIRPNLIVNAAAYTAVDKAESEPELAQQVNGDSVALIAQEAKRLGAALIHYSTDYVFDGAKTTPYEEGDATNPLSVYGRTKLAGEIALADAGIRYLTLRTSWVYGARGKNFLRTIVKLAAEKPELRIVDDQWGAPTWSREIAMTTAKIAKRWMEGDAERLSGVYHLTASGETTWHGFAAEAIRMLEENPTARIHNLARLTGISTLEYPTPATRPKNSRLNCGKLTQTFGVRLLDWKESLTQVVPAIVEM